MCNTSKNKLKRKLSVSTRKKLVEYWLSGIKDERRIRQEYGVDKRMLQQFNRWYRKMKEKQHTPSGIHLKKPRKMKSEKKAMQDRIKALERDIPLRKKLGAKHSSRNEKELPKSFCEANEWIVWQGFRLDENSSPFFTKGVFIQTESLLF